MEFALQVQNVKSLVIPLCVLVEMVKSEIHLCNAMKTNKIIPFKLLTLVLQALAEFMQIVEFKITSELVSVIKTILVIPIKAVDLNVF